MILSSVYVYLNGVYNNRITEWFRLAGTLKITWFQPHCLGQGCHPRDQVFRAPRNVALLTEVVNTEVMLPAMGYSQLL